jgi:transposase
VRGLDARAAALIRIDAVWLATTPLDMRAGTANRRATRMKVLVHDGLGVWLAARRLHQGRFVWPHDVTRGQVPLTLPQLQALVLGLPWQRIEDDGAIRLL